MPAIKTTEDDIKLLSEALDKIQPTAEAAGIELRMIEIKGTIYFFPLLPAKED